MTVLFTSDLHLGHERAARNRGFASRDEHDDYVIETLRRQCNKRSLLWVLGDVAMWREKLALLDTIPGAKRLVRGNHDLWSTDLYRQYFQEVHGFLRYKTWWLSHCPIHPQELYRCKLNVHGHIHANSLSPLLPMPYFNVNWDFWGRALKLEEIREISPA